MAAVSKREPEPLVLAQRALQEFRDLIEANGILKNSLLGTWSRCLVQAAETNLLYQEQWEERSLRHTQKLMEWTEAEIKRVQALGEVAAKQQVLANTILRAAEVRRDELLTKISDEMKPMILAHIKAGVVIREKTYNQRMKFIWILIVGGATLAVFIAGIVAGAWLQSPA